MRFQWFLSVQDKIKSFDICYYFNANSKFLRIVDENIIPVPNEMNPLIFWVHARHENDYDGTTFHPERNDNSTAYVPNGQPCRCYGGGFFGGLVDDFMKMCQTLRDNIMVDMSNDYIAVWHDQSHIIKYAINVPHIEVPFGLISEEEYVYSEKCCIIFEAKKKYGGNDAMRDSSMLTRIKHLPDKLLGKLIVLLVKLNVYNSIRKILKKNG